MRAAQPAAKPLADALDRLRAARTASAGPERAEGQVANDATFGLRVYALGDETIERDGVTVSTHEWRSSRAKSSSSICCSRAQAAQKS
ncbi:MAG: hypothetical protein HND48_15875 [Chloroflexi bacterium]|nr:hypothetical protein [Chloroflexota bacterium]